MSDVDWTDQQLDRFMAAEICIDELMQINDEFPGNFSVGELRAIRTLQQGPFDGFAAELPSSRMLRMKLVRDRLQAAFPVKHRTHAERIMKSAAQANAQGGG